ncbi:MAG: MgtC/SapB family protein [Phycisphaerales bacterium]|nr:MgtC/SapB family protein [Phycisphaerales bacterium]
MHISIWEALARLGTALIAGAVIGWEREASGRAAGLRTHMLVALGSAGFSFIGVELISMTRQSSGHAGDLLRVIEAVATGVGFLGAGAIMQSGKQVKGLTTAASIWIVAAAGVAAGVGLWMIAVLLTIFALVTLSLLRFMTRSDAPAPDSSE